MILVRQERFDRCVQRQCLGVWRARSAGAVHTRSARRNVPRIAFASVSDRGSNGSSDGNAPFRVAAVAPLQIIVSRTSMKLSFLELLS